MTGNGFLERYLMERPMHLALLRAAECQLFSQVDLKPPVLDIGCGDGFFSQVAFKMPLDLGVDVSRKYVREAVRGQGYRRVDLASCTNLPYRDLSIGAVITNSTLEHVRDLERAVREIGRVLQPNARLVLTVPKSDYTDFLFGTALFRRLRMPFLARTYAEYMTRISRHYNYLTLQEWRMLLEGAQLEVMEHRDYFSRQSAWAFDLLHVFGYLAFVWRVFLGRWTLLPGTTAHLPLGRWLAKFAVPDGSAGGAYLFLVCRKRDLSEKSP